MAEQPKKDLRVLLPQYYPGRAQFELNGAPSGQFGAYAKINITLEAYPHWILGLRATNRVRLEGAGVTDQVAANLATSNIEVMQEIRCTIGTFQVFDWTDQILIVGDKGTLWAPFPIKFASMGNVNCVIEARRLTGYPFNLIPEFSVSLVTNSLRAGRPGHVFDLDVT